MIKRVQSNTVPESDAPFSQIVLDDRYAYLAGLVAADFPHGLAVLGDVSAETKAVMGAISDMLKEVGLSFEDVVKAEVIQISEMYFSFNDVLKAQPNFL
jgi:2-iminobutanoate/2-iminopropanoate deaminase